jgi:hypothetical protein
MSRGRAKLKVVPEEPVPVGPDELLAIYVPALIEAEREVKRLRQSVSENGRLLARDRGVAFIREERLRQEFGDGLA